MLSKKSDSIVGMKKFLWQYSFAEGKAHCVQIAIHYAKLKFTPGNERFLVVTEFCSVYWLK